MHFVRNSMHSKRTCHLQGFYVKGADVNKLAVLYTATSIRLCFFSAGGVNACAGVLFWFAFRHWYSCLDYLCCLVQNSLQSVTVRKFNLTKYFMILRRKQNLWKPFCRFIVSLIGGKGSNIHISCLAIFIYLEHEHMNIRPSNYRRWLRDWRSTFKVQFVLCFLVHKDQESQFPAQILAAKQRKLITH